MTLVSVSDTFIDTKWLYPDPNVPYGTVDLPSGLPPDTRHYLLETCLDSRSRWVARVSDPLIAPAP